MRFSNNGDLLEQFFSQIKAHIASNQSLGQIVTINVASNAQFIASLQNYLQANKQLNLRKAVDKFHFFKGDNERAAFDQFIESFLTFVKEFNVYSMIESIDLILNYINQLVVVFNNYDELSHMLLATLSCDLQYVYQISKTIDKVLAVNGISRSNAIQTKFTSYLSKLFNNCKKNQFKNPTKKAMLLKVSNFLVLIYFNINQPLNCNTIFIINRHNFKTLKGSNFGKNDLIKYRYYLGKYLVINQFFTVALIQFKYCYINFPINKLRGPNSNAKTIKQFDSILEYFVILLMITGHKPSRVLISKFSNSFHQQLYFELIRAIQSGNMTRFEQILQFHREYYRSKSLYNLMLKNLSMIVYRNLFYKIFKFINNGQITSNYQNVLDYKLFAAGLAISEQGIQKPLDTQNTTESIYEHVEEILVSLIDKKWAKGIIFPQSSKLSLSKKGDAFPQISQGLDVGRHDYDWLDK